MSHRLLIRRLSPWALGLQLLLASLAVPASPSAVLPEEPQTVGAWDQAELPGAEPSSSSETSSWPTRASEWLSEAGPWALPVAWAGAALLAAALAVQILRGRKSRKLARTRAAVHAAALSRAAEWRNGETRRAAEAPRNRPSDGPARTQAEGTNGPKPRPASAHQPDAPSTREPERPKAAVPRPAAPAPQPARRDPVDRNVERTRPAKQATTTHATRSPDAAHAPSGASRSGDAAARVFAAEGVALDEAMILAWHAILSASQESSAPSLANARAEQKGPAAAEAPPEPVREPVVTVGAVREPELVLPEAKGEEVASPVAPRPEEPRPAPPETPHAPPLHAQAGPLPTPPPPTRVEEPATPPASAVPDDPEAASLLLHLSQREAALGHVDEALESAREAHRALRSRASLLHLIRLLTVARRFEPQDRERLRRAVRKQPDAPVLLHAAGVSESLHGDPWAARGLLLEALRLERREEIRAEILGVLTSLDAPQRRASAPESADHPGRDAPTQVDPPQDAPAPPTH